MSELGLGVRGGKKPVIGKHSVTEANVLCRKELRREVRLQKAKADIWARRTENLGHLDWMGLEKRGRVESAAFGV